MTAFVTDTFTDTDNVSILSHTGELGATWIKYAGLATNALESKVGTNKLVAGEATGNIAFYQASGTPASADYSATADVQFNGSASTFSGPMIRMPLGGSSGYLLRYSTGNVAPTLTMYLSASSSTIGTGPSFVPTSGVVYRYTLSATGTSLVCTCQRLSDNQYLNSAGSWQSGATTFLTVTDANITAAGKPGVVHYQAAATPEVIDNFSADQVGGADTTPPTLTSPVGASTGTTTGSGGVTTDEANGTLYAVCQLSATAAPSVAQVKAGQNGAGASAPYASNQAITTTGAKTTAATGLTASTAYKWYFVHRDAAGNDSSVAASSAFTTASTNPAPTFPGSISNIGGTAGTAITTVNVSSNFSDTDTLTYSASPGGTSWPSGLSINSSTGVISGTPAANATTTGCKVRATDTASQTVDSNAFNFVIAAVVVHAAVTLTSDGTTPRASLTGLKWSWFDQITPDLFTAAPTDKGSAGTTDASGNFSVVLSGTAKTVGQVGFLLISDSDGAPGQSPSSKAFAGPVTITSVAPSDVTAPTLISATVSNSTPSQIDLIWSEPMNATMSAAAAFAVSAGHALTAHTYVDSTHSNLTTSTPFIAGESKTLAYTQPGSNKMQDLAGNLLANIAGASIVDNVSAAFTENFNRADGALGSPWSVLTGLGWSVVSNQASSPVSNPGIDIRPYAGDGSIQIDRVSGNPGVVFRVQDASNYVAANWNGSTVTLYKKTAGVTGTLGTYATGSVSTLKVTFVGTALEVFVNGVSRITATDGYLASLTNVGLISFASGVVVDNVVTT